MNKIKKLAQLLEIYGTKCTICNINMADSIRPIVPHNCLKTLRQINKRKSRANARVLPVFSTWQIQNLLSVCRQCLDRTVHQSIYECCTKVVLTRIDEKRLAVGYILLESVVNQRQFRMALVRKLNLEGRSY
ncbi:MAG: hypothetical protein K2Y14_01210 [Burkholderiales bacterium]|nr:hypothetical protein [Burkholderiales bacterium]